MSYGLTHLSKEALQPVSRIVGVPIALPSAKRSATLVGNDGHLVTLVVLHRQGCLEERHNRLSWTPHRRRQHQPASPTSRWKQRRREGGLLLLLLLLLKLLLLRPFLLLIERRSPHGDEAWHGPQRRVSTSSRTPNGLKVCVQHVESAASLASLGSKHRDSAPVLDRRI